MHTADILVIGATFCGCAIALNSNKKVIVAESGFVLGSEFAQSMNQKRPKKTQFCTDLGKTFECELKKRGLLNENGEIYAQPAVFVLSSLLKEKGTDVRLNTVVTDIQIKDDGYLVTLFESEGFYNLTVKTIIDTTSTGVFCTFPREKCLCTTVQGKGDIQNEITGAGCSIVALKEEDTWYTAREKALKRAKTDGEKIIMTANAFAYRDQVNMQSAPYGTFLPSDGFYNLTDAFEGGAAYAEKL